MVAKKSKKLTDLLDGLGKNLAGGITRTQAFNEYRCVSCGGSKGRFRDELSAKEYAISGFCQSCQNKVFDHE